MAFKRFISVFTSQVTHNFENNINRRYASNYKAAVLKNLNEPLTIEEFNQKKLKRGEVRIKVHACSINSSDYLLTQGANPGNFPLPIVPGYEVSGTVLETQDCMEIAKGDKVVALSKSTLGGFAEECIVDEKDAWILPGGLDFKIAAALPDSFGTAMLGLVHRGHLSEKQTVLVTMAAAHGFAALDLAANVYKAKVRIKVHACSINSSDYLLTQGANPGNFPLPIVPGYEVSGTVLETQDCMEIAKGDKVVALSKSTLGGFAEECIVDEKDAWILPGGLDFKIAAALPDSFGTAMLGLVHRGHLSEKQTVLVTMAAAHGFAALDLAANVYKAKVIAVCMSDEETSILRKRGAWMATSFSEKEILHDVKELTKDVGLNVIYDTLGGEVLHTCMKCISHEGHIIIAGYTLSELPRVRISELLALPCFSLSGVSLTSYRKHDFSVYRKAVDDALDMKEQGLISPVISATFPLQEVNKAMELIKEKQPLGKIVLEIV